MIDTIRLRLHCILDVKQDIFSYMRKENQGITDLLVPEHNAIYKKLIEYKGKNFTMQTVFNRETMSLEPINEDDFLLMENAAKLNQFYQNRNMVRFVSGKTTVDKKMRIKGDYRIKSSTPDVHFIINENASYIDFEFSIPKYLYGHNLALFVPQILSTTYYKNPNAFQDWNAQVNMIYPRLMKFIEKFFTDLMNFFELDTYPNMDYIEIRRIDLCYNQFFDSKSDALSFLNEVQKLRKEKSYKTKNERKKFGTTYDIFTSFGSYFKIYHKGSEYSKTQGDLSKHMKINCDFLELRSKKSFKASLNKHQLKLLENNQDLIMHIFENYAKESPIVLDDAKRAEIREITNKVKSKLPYDVVFLKNQMDKVLRYEVSLSGQFFQNLYKRKVFRRKDKIHKEFMDQYKVVSSQKQSSRPNKKRITREQHINYKEMHTYLNRSVSLVLSNSFTLKRFEAYSGTDYNKVTERYVISRFAGAGILNNKDVGIFSEFFLRLCFKHFKELINKHQPKVITSFDDLAAKIGVYNEKVEQRLREYDEFNHFLMFNDNGTKKIKNGKAVTKPSQLLTQTQKRNLKLKTVNANILLMLLSQLEQGISLQQYRDKSNMNKSTFFRYKKDLEMFGIFENSLQMEKPINVETNFRRYYWLTESIYNQEKFFTNPNQKYYG